MKTFVKVPTDNEVLDTITCDCCKKTFTTSEDYIDTEEFLNIERINGYGSIFGDGNVMRLDLCQHCIKKLLGEYIRIEEKEWTNLNLYMFMKHQNFIV